MGTTVRIHVEDEPLPFDLDLTARRWSTQCDIAEGCLPLVAEVEGKRYELYSDGTLAEVEM